jgi:fatty-acyl-CoA synthase
MSPTSRRSPIDHAARWASHLPERVALSFEGASWSYGELHRRAERTARLLTEELGLARGDRIAVLAESHPVFFELLFACLRAGLVLAPLNWRLAPTELEALLELGEPRLLIVDEAFQAVAEGLARPAGCALLHQDRLLESPPPVDEGAPPLVGTDMEELALLLFTSGTTGLPKAAMLPARQLFWNDLNTQLAWDLRRDDRTILYTPLFHTGAINVLAMPLLRLGGHVIVQRSFDAAAALQAIRGEAVSVVFGVPTTFQMLSEEPAFTEPATLASVRLCVCGGAPLSTTLIQTYSAHGMKLTQGFGMTEVGPNCFFLPPDQILTRAGSVGRPIHHAEARVRVGDRDARVDEVGELELRGPHVCQGYFRDAEATAKSFDGDWFKTGDMARRDADGYYTIAGRAKDMFISGGENVYPAEVEVALMTHAGVAECAVVAAPHDRWGEVGCAFVIPSTDELGEESLRAHARAMLAGYKVPKRFVLVDDLPRNPSGKVQKPELARLAAAR